MRTPTKNYVKAQNKQAHRSLTSEQIRDLFIQVGWIGRRQQINPVLKVVPFFDRGRGPCV